jgi:hypothetical protein
MVAMILPSAPGGLKKSDGPPIFLRHKKRLAPDPAPKRWPMRHARQRFAWDPVFNTKISSQSAQFSITPI